MKKIICKNKNNDKTEFTYEFPFFLKSIDGLYSISGEINTNDNANGIGKTYSGTSIKERVITLTGIIIDKLELRRKQLYKTFKMKQEGTLFYYDNENTKGKKISYIVEDVEISDTGFPKIFTISLMCPDPYFKDLEESEISMATWSPAFCFPMISEENEGLEFATKNITTMGTIINESDLDLGMTIHFVAHGHVLNPFVVNVETQEQILIEVEMNPGDEIIVTTYRGNKNIILIKDDTKIMSEVNYLIKYGSKFLQLHSGTNTLRAGAEEDEENLETKIFYCNEYEAV